MTVAEGHAWRAELGIDTLDSSVFFADGPSIDSDSRPTAHTHVVRRAFDLLRLDGVLCTQNAPIVYIKLVSKIRFEDVVALHRRFWNHGGAPVLLVISPNEVQVYSSLTRPLDDSSGSISEVIRHGLCPKSN
jgi:hypothetical protein